MTVIGTSVNIYFTRLYRYYGGELAYYVFYTVVIVTFIYTCSIYFTRRNYYGGGLTFLSY
jgi:hypothetical protein